MDSQTRNEITEELDYLYNKRSTYGWTQTDADRVKYLEKFL